MHLTKYREHGNHIVRLRIIHHLQFSLVEYFSMNSHQRTKHDNKPFSPHLNLTCRKKLVEYAPFYHDQTLNQITKL